MSSPCTAVLDVGKTHAKLSLWTRGGVLCARRTHVNARLEARRYQTLDIAGIEAWARTTLAEFATLGGIDTLIPVGHGAAAVSLRGGRVAAPPMDYETFIPEDVRRRYSQVRDKFADTGSPFLPAGLNLGAQLFWLEELDPTLRDEDVMILPWTQYWAWVLCGVAASEVTSLGCHTDLWQPAAGTFSQLAVARGWNRRFAPLRRADDILGTLRPDWVRQTGLPAGTQVLCGLHDSNAALLAARGFREIADQDATVVSTGTWFVAMRTPARGAPAHGTPAHGTPARGAPAHGTPAPIHLPEHRDCLINVDAYGQPIPSARFMGGRELELLGARHGKRLDQAEDQASLLAAVAQVLRADAMALPTLAPGSGPYPRARHRWRQEPDTADAHRAVAGLYAALVMQRSLSLIEARGVLLIEGRFAEADVFVGALASLLPQCTVYVSHAHNGVSYGALRLIHPALPPPGRLLHVAPLAADLGDYAARWHHEAAQERAA